MLMASEQNELARFLASIVDSSDDAILSKDMSGKILSWNEGAKQLYGYTAEEMIGKHISILAPPDRPNEIPEIMRRLAKGERIKHYETVRLRKDGTSVHISLTLSPITNSAGEVIAVSAIARDITNRKKDEEEKNHLLNELTNSLAQKNVLLQEIYHRVKNNLQVISSLLELRSRSLSQDPKEAAAAFMDTIARIRAMALVHEKLYKTGNLDKLDFTVYLHNLVQQLLKSYAADKRIELKITGGPCYFALDRAVPLGLIFSELITNSLKYAYPSGAGLIEIDFQIDDHTTTVQISDYGGGLPTHIDFQTAKSFGFRIVKLLSKQIHAQIVHQRVGNGTSFTINIPNSRTQEEV
jgi:PAS domain S-box-containing protein